MCVFAEKLAWSRLWWDYVYICNRGIYFAPIFTSIYYILELIMIEGCVICYFCFYFIHYTRNVRKLTTIHLLYFIQCLALKYNCTQYQRFTFICMKFVYFYLAVLCITITSHHWIQTRLATWRTFLICKYSTFLLSIFCNLQFMYLYNVSSLRPICSTYSISTTRLFLTLINYTSIEELVMIEGIR